MGLESATYISDLNSAWPLGTDQKSTADDHTRLIKTVLQATFPNINAAVNATPAQLNYLVGLAASVPTILKAFKSATTSRLNTTTVSADPDLTLNLTVGTWQFEIFAVNWTPAGGPPFSFGVGYSGTYTALPSSYIYVYSTASAQCALSGIGGVNTAQFAAVGMPNAQGVDAILSKGSIVVTGNGALAFNWGPYSLDASHAVNIGQGSYITAMKLG